MMMIDMIVSIVSIGQRKLTGRVTSNKNKNKQNNTIDYNKIDCSLTEKLRIKEEEEEKKDWGLKKGKRDYRKGKTKGRGVWL